MEKHTQHPLFQSPTVFNFFQPDYSTSSELSVNGLVSSELQLLNDLSVYEIQNGLRQIIYEKGDLTNSPDHLKPLFPKSFHRVRPDFSHYHAIYLAVLDENSDGLFNSTDVGTFDNAPKIEKACIEILDKADLILTGGLIKNQSTEISTPCGLILHALTSTLDNRNDDDDSVIKYDVFKERIQSLFWLVTASPEFIIQR